MYYKGERLDQALRLDLWVDRKVIVEVKCVAAIEDIHRAQLLTYLRHVGCAVGLLINFNVVVLKRGIKRVVNALRPSAFSAALR